MPGDLVVDGLVEQIDGEVDLRLEDHLIGNASGLTTRGIFGPGLRQVEREVDRQVLCPCRYAEAHADLTVGDLTGRSRVLTLDADRVLSLLEEPRVVDDPRGHGFLLLQSFDPVPCSLPPHETVAPRTAPDEVQQAVVHPFALPLVARRACCDRFDALSFAVADESERVGRERGALLAALQVLADPLVEELVHPSVHIRAHLEGHGPTHSHSFDKWDQFQTSIWRAQ